MASQCWEHTRREAAKRTMDIHTNLGFVKWCPCLFGKKKQNSNSRLCGDIGGLCAVPPAVTQVNSLDSDTLTAWAQRGWELLGTYTPRNREAVKRWSGGSPETGFDF